MYELVDLINFRSSYLIYLFFNKENDTNGIVTISLAVVKGTIFFVDIYYINFCTNRIIDFEIFRRDIFLGFFIAVNDSA